MQWTACRGRTRLQARQARSPTRPFWRSHVLRYRWRCPSNVTAPMITVHHLNNSRSQRVLWLLEELGLAYEIRRSQSGPKTMLAPPSLRAVHPLGKSPVITDGALTLAESGAIIEYVVDRYGDGRLTAGPGTHERVRHTS